MFLVLTFDPAALLCMLSHSRRPHLPFSRRETCRMRHRNKGRWQNSRRNRSRNLPRLLETRCRTQDLQKPERVCFPGIHHSLVCGLGISDWQLLERESHHQCGSWILILFGAKTFSPVHQWCFLSPSKGPS